MDKDLKITDLPMHPLPDDAVDMAARAVAAEVAAHIREMYPKAAEAVSVPSMTRSLTGVIRNNMKRLGRAAESGDLEGEIEKMRQERTRRRALRCTT